MNRQIYHISVMLIRSVLVTFGTEQNQNFGNSVANLIHTHMDAIGMKIINFSKKTLLGHYGKSSTTMLFEKEIWQGLASRAGANEKPGHTP